MLAFRGRTAWTSQRDSWTGQEQDQQGQSPSHMIWTVYIYNGNTDIFTDILTGVLEEKIVIQPQNELGTFGVHPNFLHAILSHPA